MTELKAVDEQFNGWTYGHLLVQGTRFLFGRSDESPFLVGGEVRRSETLTC